MCLPKRFLKELNLLQSKPAQGQGQTYMWKVYFYFTKEIQVRNLGQGTQPPSSRARFQPCFYYSSNFPFTTQYSTPLGMLPDRICFRSPYILATI